MQYSFRHSMPGRVRLSIPALSHNRRLAENFLSWLKSQAGVRSARINFDCASLVLEYDPEKEALLRLLLERVKGASVAEVKAFCAATAAATPQANTSAQEVSKQSPLALPTLSLVMAFSSNPLLVGLNMPLMLWNAIPIA